MKIPMMFVIDLEKILAVMWKHKTLQEQNSSKQRELVGITIPDLKFYYMTIVNNHINTNMMVST